MFEKSIITILKSLSAVIYVVIMVALFSFPVSFIVHAFIPPVFSLSKIEYEQVGDAAEKEYRIDYYITASSGKYSPYEYTIDEIALKNDEFLSFAESYEVTLDEPSSFTKDNHDEMIISLHINTEEDFDIQQICKEAEFKTKVYEKGFGEFKVKYGSDNKETDNN